MSKTNLWTKNFIALIATNGLLFASFHVLLPTLPIYAGNIGANGVQIGMISGIFGFSAIFIRLFTDTDAGKQFAGLEFGFSRGRSTNPHRRQHDVL